MITWGFPIWLYLWLAGMAAGAYFAAFLAEHFGGHTDRRLLRMAIYLGIPLASLGVVFLLMDLGHPLRFWHLLVRFNISSPMSVGSWLLLLWVGIAFLAVVLWHARRRWSISAPGLDRLIEWLYRADFFLSIFLMGYTGVLLAASNQPLWTATILLPSLFVTSAVSTGAAILVLTALVTRTWKSLGETIRRMVEADAVIIVVELLVLLGFLFWLPRAPIPGADEAMRRLTTGVLAARFWLGVVLLALLVPFALDIAHWGKALESHKAVFGAAVASSACVILGALILRAVVVIGGQM